MKIVIGITQEPERSAEYLSRKYGESGSMTEIGPFRSKQDALDWLLYLKGEIGDVEELIPEQRSDNEQIWYGFAFEMGAGSGEPTACLAGGFSENLRQIDS